MSNQIVISSGAKVRSLEGVLTGTAGIVNSVPLGGANGVATLDSNGKVPLSQLPASVVTYLGTWNAATNTPTLANGTGDVGDLYICNVAGTVNFGAGPITFAVGDWVIYNGSQWQKSAGSSGTVTSVAVSSTGNDAISITGSPITTSGTINIGFTGTSAQYVNGAGDLTTFPSLTGYVPYTGATQTVDLGAWDLNARGVKINGTGGSGHVDFKHQSGTPTGSASSSTLYADTNGNIAWLNDHLYTTTLVSNANTADRSYTFPDYSGTVALLGGSQTFSGQKTFSSVIIGDSGVSLKEGVIPSAVGYTGLAGDPDGLVISKKIGTTAYTNLLYFTSATSNTYTFPNASGTIALTSNLSSYVPYTGATSNLNLGTNALLASTLSVLGSGTTAGYLSFTPNTNNAYSAWTSVAAVGDSALAFSFMPSAGQKIFKIDASGLTVSTTRTYTMPDASGTLALTSNLTGYVPYTGATTNVDLGSNTLTANYITSGNIVFWKGTGTGLGNIGLGRIVPLGNNTTGQVNLGILEGALFSNTTGNNNIALGGGTMYSNTTGSNNIGIGGGANRTNTTGDGNIAIGVNALYNNTVNYNIAIGAGSLYTNTTGNNNIGIGQNTLYATTTGSQNTAIGTNSLTNQTTGINNTALGISTGINITTGIQNTLIGYSAGAGITTGSHNTIIGGNVGALASNLTNNVIIADGQGNYRFQWDSNNTILGQSGNVGIGNSNPSSKLDVYISSVGTYFRGGSDNTARQLKISSSTTTNAGDTHTFDAQSGTGNLVFATTSTERMRITSGGNIGIGNTGLSGQRVRIYGETNDSSSYAFVLCSANGTDLFNVRSDSALNLGQLSTNFTTASAANLYVNPGNGFVYRSTSSLKYKKNVEDYTKGLTEVMQLRAVTYEGKSEADEGKVFAGLIAEEVHDLGLTEFVQYAEDGSPDALYYQNMVSLLVKAIQEQNQLIQELSSKVSALENKS